jgi:hypothetical protein
MKLAAAASAKNIPFIIASATADQVRKDVRIPVMKSDLVAIKTAARVDPTIYLLNNGNIEEKWALNDMEKAMKHIN